MRAAKTSRRLTGIGVSPGVWQAGYEYTSSAADRESFAAAPVTTGASRFAGGEASWLCGRRGASGCIATGRQAADGSNAYWWPGRSQAPLREGSCCPAHRRLVPLRDRV